MPLVKRKFREHLSVGTLLCATCSTVLYLSSSREESWVDSGDLLTVIFCGSNGRSSDIQLHAILPDGRLVTCFFHPERFASKFQQVVVP